MTTPKCPVCRAKFSHDSATAACKICGVPDEVLSKGHHEVARWRRRMGFTHSPRPASANRRKKAHGRR